MQLIEGEQFFYILPPFLLSVVGVPNANSWSSKNGQEIKLVNRSSSDAKISRKYTGLCDRYDSSTIIINL